MKSYYEERAAEYDATSYELVYEDDRAASDLVELESLIAGLQFDRVLDIGCGTGWLTKSLPGSVVALDQSQGMLTIARQRRPSALFVNVAFPPLPFLAGSFDLAFTSHVYSHFRRGGRRSFAREALRVAHELIIVEQAWPPGLAREGRELRTLRNGRRHWIHKRYFSAEELAEEVNGTVVLDSPTFVAVSARGAKALMATTASSGASKA
jgi:SAM-dependent methyltransferase